eukprot:6492333-Amphidinium_carterae.2
MSQLTWHDEGAKNLVNREYRTVQQHIAKWDSILECNSVLLGRTADVNYVPTDTCSQMSLRCCSHYLVIVIRAGG